jgi:hypothetical protein
MHEIRVQAGTAAGASLAAKFVASTTPTVVLRGIEELSMRPDNNTGVLDDMSQGLAGSSTAVVRGVGASGGVQGWASYEHLCYWFDNLLGQATPSGSGTYTRAYAAPTTTAPTPRILPLVKGDSSVGAYQMVGALLTRFKMTLEPEEVLKFDGDLIGNKLEADTLASLSTPTVYPIMADHVASLYWDDWDGTMGSTALTECTMRFMELELRPDRNARACVGSLTKDRFIEGPWTGSLKLTLEFNATTKADVDDIIGGTLTQKQFEANFADGVSGRTLALQFAGTVTEGPEIFSDDDNVVTVDLTLERTYHATFANWFKAEVVNAVETLS